MNGPKQAGRGRPVRALGVVLGGWVLMRAAMWQSPVEPPALLPQFEARPAALLAGSAMRPLARPEEPGEALHPGTTAQSWELAPVAPAMARPVGPQPVSWQDYGQSAALPVRGAAPVSARYIVGHTLLLAAGLSRMELDPALHPYAQGAGPRLAQPAPAFAPAAAERFMRETAAPPRWSMDAWALWRENDNSPLLSGRPSYGRSQIGAVLRFALAPSSGHAPQAYLRASAALAGAREQEGALGISARPLPFVPVRLAGEARLRQSGQGTDTRLAAFAVSEFPPLPLPGGTTGEAYVQGGYVTGRDATGFVDGQARITRDLASGDRLRLSAGGGAWGGAQEGSGRLDIGPSASVSVSAGGLNARVSADYRFRVAGAAEPASGPALTISAGF